jgi:hypothetical protein
MILPIVLQFSNLEYVRVPICRFQLTPREDFACGVSVNLALTVLFVSKNRIELRTRRMRSVT